MKLRVGVAVVASGLGLLSGLALWGQRPSPPGLSQANQAVVQGEKNVPPPVEQRPAQDIARLKHDADELATLAQTIPGGVDQATKGILQKDLGDRLKKIEKLAKELRGQISR
jgi:hypothetical protein